jgi:hypothetical protein
VSARGSVPARRFTPSPKNEEHRVWRETTEVRGGLSLNNGFQLFEWRETCFAHEVTGNDGNGTTPIDTYDRIGVGGPGESPERRAEREPGSASTDAFAQVPRVEGPAVRGAAGLV